MNCVNCSATKNLKEYYIVPLNNGGYNTDSNKVYLCHKCAKLSPLSVIKKNGRPSFGKAEDFEDTLYDWFHCRIGTKEAKDIIGLKQSNQSTWTRLQKEYMLKHDIEHNRNNIDVLNGKCYNNALKIGYIKYKGQDIRYFYNNKSTL